MKNLALIIFLLPYFCFAQQADHEKKDIKFIKVIEFDSMTIGTIIEKSKDWIVNQQFEIKSEKPNQLVAPGFVSLEVPALSMANKMEVHFLLTIQAKEGKVRMILDNTKRLTGSMQVSGTLTDTRTNQNDVIVSLYNTYYKNNGKAKARKKIHGQIEGAVLSLMDSYNEHMQGKVDKW